MRGLPVHYWLPMSALYALPAHYPFTLWTQLNSSLIASRRHDEIQKKDRDMLREESSMASRSAD